jgi:hypothetical protein
MSASATPSRPRSLVTFAGEDLAPCMRWLAPLLAIDADADRGLVLVLVEYQINPEKSNRFLARLWTHNR